MIILKASGYPGAFIFPFTPFLSQNFYPVFIKRSANSNFEENERLKNLMNKYEKSFVEALRAGQVHVSEIDDYIEYWHTHITNNNLREFLGMTQQEYDMWVVNFVTSKSYEDGLLAVLGIEVEPAKVPVCVVCGGPMGVETAVGIIAKSNYIGTDTCRDCQLEYCLNTNCLGCEIGNHLESYTECEHLPLKKFYMEEERREREEDGRKKKDGDVNDP